MGREAAWVGRGGGVAVGREADGGGVRGVVEAGLGSGQTISRQFGGQYSLILLKRYSLLSRGSPGGGMRGGSCVHDGAHCRLALVRRVIFFSGVSVISLTIASPGVLLENTRWWRDLIPLNAWRLKNVFR